MSDAEREAQIRRDYGSQEFVVFLLRLLAQARTDCTTACELAQAITNELTEAQAEIARLQAPPGTSAYERAERIVGAHVDGLGAWTTETFAELVATLKTEFAHEIEQAEREARAKEQARYDALKHDTENMLTVAVEGARAAMREECEQAIRGHWLGERTRDEIELEDVLESIRSIPDTAPQEKSKS